MGLNALTSYTYSVSAIDNAGNESGKRNAAASTSACGGGVSWAEAIGGVGDDGGQICISSQW